jgi:ribonuclease P protein component
MAMPGARLVRRADYLRVAATRKKAATGGLILQAAPMDNSAHSAPGLAPAFRVGFTCSRKVGNAVMRNRARRRLKEAARRVLAEARPGYDYVLIGRTETVTRPFERLLADLRAALAKLGLLAGAEEARS